MLHESQFYTKLYENTNEIKENVSDIEYHDGNRAGDVRVMYMNQDQISERENSFKITW